MATGIQSKGVDLDSIFDPYVVGTSPGLTGCTFGAGKTDINTRYAPLVYGTQASATGIACKVGGAGSFVDLNTLFAAKGTARYNTPDNGTSYASTRTVAVGGSGVASVAIYATQTQYEVQIATNSGTTVYGPFNIPASVSQFYTKLVQTSAPDSHYAQTVVHDSVWTNLSALPASGFALLAQATITINNAVQGQTDTGTATLTLNFGNAGSAMFTGSNNWTMTVRNTT